MNEIANDGIIRYRGYFNQEQILLCSPQAIGEVLVTHAYKFEKPSAVRGAIVRILGKGLLFAEGEEHKLHRRKLLPAFAYRQIKNLYPLFWDKACEGVHAMTEEVDKTGQVEVQGWASRLALDIIGVAGLGRDFGAIRNPDDPLVKTYATILKPTLAALVLTVMRLFLPASIVNVIPVRTNGDMATASQHIRDVCRDLVKTRKARMQEEDEQAATDLISTALKCDTFSDDQVADLMMQFLPAGHETTASSLGWALYALCKNPEMQQRLRAEVHEKLPAVESGEAITSEMIDDMPYLEAVSSEILRLYPPVPQIVREPLENTTLLGLPLRKGTRIVICIWGVNRSREHWGDNAAEFRPERWLEAHHAAGPNHGGRDPLYVELQQKDAQHKPMSGPGGSSSAYSFLTFVAGPRSCIGQSFARAEFKCILAAWISRFEFELSDPAMLDEQDGLTYGKGFTMKPGKDGLFLKVKKVDSA